MENQSSFKMRKINDIADIKAAEHDNLLVDKENSDDKSDKNKYKKENK